MLRLRSSGRKKTRGFALLTVVLFALVVTIAGMFFFSISSSETRQALYRQRSSEAFYLADGAIERARAKFLEDRLWWRPPNSPTFSGSAGNGTYDLTVSEIGTGDSVSLVANGVVGNAARRIAVTAIVPPTGLNMPLFIGGNLDAGGSLCIDGTVHVNGTGDDGHLTCDYVFSDGFTLYPPPIYTDPAHFPDATYYVVKGTRVGSNWRARIFDEFGNDITGPNDMSNVISYNSGSNTFIFSFNSVSKVNQYFSSGSAVFRRTGSDIAAVVNFGEVPLYDPPGPVGPEGVRTAVIFDAGSSTTINQTIIDTRFVGVTEDDRYYPSGWFGGQITVRQIRFEPYYGIATIAYDFGRQGGSQVYMGSETWPALVYVTNNAGIPDQINSNTEFVGCVICLGSWRSSGNPEIHYDDGFIENLPDYLHDEWISGSGSLSIVNWREVAAS